MASYVNTLISSFPESLDEKPRFSNLNAFRDVDAMPSQVCVYLNHVHVEEDAI